MVIRGILGYLFIHRFFFLIEKRSILGERTNLGRLENCRGYIYAQLYCLFSGIPVVMECGQRPRGRGPLCPCGCVESQVKPVLGRHPSISGQ